MIQVNVLLGFMNYVLKINFLVLIPFGVIVNLNYIVGEYITSLIVDGQEFPNSSKKDFPFQKNHINSHLHLVYHLEYIMTFR